MTRLLRGSVLALSGFFFIACLGASPVSRAQTASIDSSGRSDTDLEDVIVEGRRFRTDTTVSSTKFQERVAETAQSISVLDEKLFQDIGVSDYTQALNYVPGAANTGSWGAQLNLESRGYFIGNDNSFRTNGASIGEGRILDSIAVRQMEVVRGGAGAIYGEGGPGGFVNLITPRPTGSLAYGGDAQLGSFDFRRIDAYVSGPLVSSGNMRGYVAAAYQNNDTYSRFEAQQVRAVYGAFDADITDKLSLQLTGYYDHWKMTGFNDNFPAQVTQDSAGNVTAVNFPTGLPIDSSSGANWNTDDDHTGLAQLNLTYAASDALRFSLLGGYTRSLQRLPIVDLCCQVSPSGFTTANTSFSGVNISSFDTEGRLTGHIAPGKWDIQYLGSVEFRRRTSDTFYSDYLTVDPNYDVYAPNRDYADPFAGRGYEDYVTSYTAQKAETRSAGVATVVRYDRRTSVTFGVHRDNYKAWRTDYAGFQSSVADTTSADGGATSFRGSVMYEVLPNVRPYYSYNETFELSFGRSCTNSSQPPQTGRVHEVGVKADLLEQKLLVTVAGYDTKTINNIELVPQSDCPTVVLPTKTGNGQTSRGGEIEVTGRLAKTWSVIAGYAHTNAILKGDPGQPDMPAPSVPPNQGSLFTVYDFVGGPLLGFGFGGGFTYQSRRLGTFGNPLYLDEQLRVNLAAYYRPSKNVAFALNARNVLNHTDVVSGLVSSDFQNRYLEPRTFLFSVHVGL